MANFALTGDGPTGFVAGNLLLHAAVVLAVHALALRLLRRAGGPPTLAPRAAFLAAALFAVHPIHAEAVVWISARKDSLCLLFYLLSVCAYLDLLESGDRRRYGWTLLWAVCALLSKASAVSLPLTLLAADLLLAPPGRPWRRRALDLAAPVALTGAAVVGYSALLGPTPRRAARPWSSTTPPTPGGRSP